MFIRAIAIMAPGMFLVAATHREHAIHALRAAGRFDGVGDNLARHQRVLHPLGAHRDTVTHGDGAEHLRHAPAGPDGGVGATGQHIEPGVAGRDRAVAIRDAHNGLGEVAIAESHGAKHRAVRGALVTLGDGLAVLIERHGVALG
jgi:hypothetical protein